MPDRADGKSSYRFVELGRGKVDLPAVFDAYKPAKALLYPPAEVAAHSHDWVEEWLAGMSR